MPVTLPEKVAALARLEAYPAETGRVRMVETHFSCLFLTARDVYKLKKPIRGNGVDHRSLASRERDCRRELRLNRRLAPGIYREVVPLRRDANGRLAIGGAGRCVDWLLRMQRLPDARTLERSLHARRTTPADAAAIAATLGRFYASLPPARITGRGYLRLLRQSVDEAARRLSRSDYGLPRDEIRALRDALRHGLVRQQASIDARVRAGRVIEGHGDLRPEHIYLGRPPQIIDALEFDRRLRVRDCLDELAFLALECERAGQPEVGAWLLHAYRRRSGDRWPPALLHLYQARHAFNRARIAIWHLDDPTTGTRQRWTRDARRYLRLARRALARMEAAQRASANGSPATRTPSRTLSPG